MAAILEIFKQNLLPHAKSDWPIILIHTAMMFRQNISYGYLVMHSVKKQPIEGK